MVGGGVHSFLKSLLAFTITLSWGGVTVADDVMASDDLADFPSSYRYVMNGSELSMFGIGSIGLVPLSASLWRLSPEDFSVTMVGGKLQNVNASTATGLLAFTIPYISCDEPDAMKAIGESFNSTNARNVLAAVLYSRTHTHCSISDTLAAAVWLDLLTVFDMDQAKQVAALRLNYDSMVIIQISADLSSLPPGTHLRPPRKGSPIPMIILYALTSMITVLLLVVIIGGAIKARRHPERYGPRARFMGRPRQSRAKGIAMAMLETLPIVKFGDPDPQQAKTAGAAEDVEMTPAAKGAAGEDKVSKPEAISQGTLNMATDKPRPITPLATTHEAGASSANQADADTTLSTSAPAPSNDDSPKVAEDSPSCSICTEDFTLGEELRVLPCNHRFHPLCVDPWLLNVSGTCPLCRIDLRPPQEPIDDFQDTIISAIHPAYSDTATRRRSTFGGIIRGTRGLDLQSIVEASREERIRILRRWREERPQQQQQSESGADATADVDANPNMRANPQRRTRPFSLLFRDRSSVRSSQDLLQPASRRNRSGTAERRPNTWYAGAGAGAADPAPQSPMSPHHVAVVEERARLWFGDLAAALSPQPQVGLSDSGRRRSLGGDAGAGTRSGR